MRMYIYDLYMKTMTVLSTKYLLLTSEEKLAFYTIERTKDTLSAKTEELK